MMGHSPIERWMRCEISTGKCAELLGMRRGQLEAIVNPMLFAVEAAVNAIGDDTARNLAARSLLAQMPLAADVLAQPAPAPAAPPAEGDKPRGVPSQFNEDGSVKPIAQILAEGGDA